MIQFSVRQLDAIKTPVLDKVLLLYKFYLVSFMICLAATLTGGAFLIISGVESCSFKQMHIFILVSIILYMTLVLDMFLSEKATLKFFNENCRNTDLTTNLQFKTFLNSVERLRYYSNQRDVSVFQVREILWNSIQIKYHKFLFFSQGICWILYGISFFFAINSVGKGCVHKNESLIIFVIFLYHNFWFIFLVGFSVVVSVSAIIFLPFLICAYFKYSDKSGFPSDPAQQQKIFLSTQLENFKYNPSNAKDTLCAICLEDFQIENPVKRTKCCKSIYHSICIQEWVCNSISCPNCRKSPFTKNKDQEPRIESVVPFNPIDHEQQNNNHGNNENNNNNPNQQNNPVLEPNNQVGGGEIQNQNSNNIEINQEANNDININQQVVQIQQMNQSQIKIDNQPSNPNNNNNISINNNIIVIDDDHNQNDQIKNDNLNNPNNNKEQINIGVQQNQNDQNEDSYIIYISTNSIHDDKKQQNINKDNNEIDQIIQINNNNDNEIRQEKNEVDKQQIQQQHQLDVSQNSKERKKHISCYTNGDNIMNNNLTEIQGQRLTINYNMDNNAINSTEISTQKIPIQSKQFDLNNQNDIADFDNIQEFKDEIDIR